MESEGLLATSTVIIRYDELPAVISVKPELKVKVPPLAMTVLVPISVAPDSDAELFCQDLKLLMSVDMVYVPAVTNEADEILMVLFVAASL